MILRLASTLFALAVAITASWYAVSLMSAAANVVR